MINSMFFSSMFNQLIFYRCSFHVFFQLILMINDQQPGGRVHRHNPIAKCSTALWFQPYEKISVDQATIRNTMNKYQMCKSTNRQMSIIITQNQQNHQSLLPMIRLFISTNQTKTNFGVWVCPPTKLIVSLPIIMVIFGWLRVSTEAMDKPIENTIKHHNLGIFNFANIIATSQHSRATCFLPIAVNLRGVVGIISKMTQY